MRSASLKWFAPLLVVLLPVSVLLSVGTGAVHISPIQVGGILLKWIGINNSIGFSEMQESVFNVLRLPRVVLASIIGAALAISGAAMQGLFRNPLADPGLVGISSGASLFAVAFIVTGLKASLHFSSLGGIYAQSIFTFAGAFIATILVYRLSQSGGKTIVSMMLLSGIAINALCSAITGLFTYSANDAQLRSIVFWTLGSLGGASWINVLGILPFTLIPILLLPRMAKSLNAFALGETNAAHLGVNTEKTKRTIIVLVACCVGASVAVAGVIVFVGLVVPHIVRMIVGPDHRYLLTLSAIAGAILLVNADIISRTLFQPSEIPIGIITGILGAPFFLYILIKEKQTKKLF
ncbi:MAG: iron ABC transporter permease [Sphingobacteriales bacterium]|nr:MAG: iron ABC transporter permease [Sphingobacteriales bacterium]